MWEATEDIDISAPPQRVWEVVADFRRHPALAGSREVNAIRFDGALEPGATFEGDITVGEVGNFVSRNVVDTVDPPNRLVWRSYPPLDEGETPDHQIEVIWSFSISPRGSGATVTHDFRVPRPKAGADELAAFFERTDRLSTVREGMRRTLENVRRAAEDSEDPEDS